MCLGLDDWTPYGDSDRNDDGLDDYNSNDGQTIADILSEIAEDRKREAFIKSLRGATASESPKTKKKTGSW